MTGAFVYDRQQELLARAQTRIRGWAPREDAVAIGHERDGRMVGVVVFDTHSPTTCFMHVAAGERRWLSKAFIVTVMAYPFLQVGYPRISCMISAENALSLRLTRLCGWTEEGRLRRAGIDGETIILFGMLREECRWLPPPLPGWPAI